MEKQKNDRLLTKKQLATVLGVSTRTIDRLRAAGMKLGETKLGRIVRFRQSEADKMVARGFKA